MTKEKAKKFKVYLVWKEGVEHDVVAQTKEEAIRVIKRAYYYDQDAFYNRHKALAEEGWEAKEIK